MKQFSIKVGPAAQRDLLAIRDFIAWHSPDRALEFYDYLLNHIRELAVFPRRYPVEPSLMSLGREIRSRPVGEYRIIYAVRERSVQVLRVRHGARGTMLSLSD